MEVAAADLVGGEQILIHGHGLIHDHCVNHYYRSDLMSS